MQPLFRRSLLFCYYCTPTYTPNLTEKAFCFLPCRYAFRCQTSFLVDNIIDLSFPDTISLIKHTRHNSNFIVNKIIMKMDVIPNTSRKTLKFLSSIRRPLVMSPECCFTWEGCWNKNKSVLSSLVTGLVRQHDVRLHKKANFIHT